MTKDKQTYNIPCDSQPAMASEPEVAYSSQSTQEHIILTIPKGVDAELLREKVNTYYSTLLQNTIKEQQFRYHYQQWINETGPLSSPYAIANNEHFRAIVKMGEFAVPFIVQKMKEDQSMIYLALEQIYHERMLEPQPLADSNMMYSWNPEENRKLWIEQTYNTLRHNPWKEICTARCTVI